MKKRGILNSEINKVISDLGHTDLIMIADCGLPIPSGVRKIDLALRPSEPSFINVLNLILHEVTVEKLYYANEIIDGGKIHSHITDLKIDSEVVSHESLKAMAKNCKAIIRTGETTPYANIILQSGVDFEGLYES